MPDSSFTITLHMVSSLDGMIAKKDNSMSWFETSDHYEKGLTVSEQDAENFLAKIDCYVMGSYTYEHALGLSKLYGWAYGDKPVIVVTQRNLTVEKPTVQLYSGNLNKLIDEQLKPVYKNVWLVGGAKLAASFIRLQRVDEIRLSIIPVILGDGVPFFTQMEREQALRVKDVTAYKNGIVELHYEVKK